MTVCVYYFLILCSLDYIPKTEEEDIVFTLAMVIVHIVHIIQTRHLIHQGLSLSFSLRQANTYILFNLLFLC